MTKKYKRRFVSALCFCFFFNSAPVMAQLFGPHGLDPSFCKMKTFRQTVIYIDDTMMVEGKTDWARKISGKLKTTLTPGEPVIVVRLSPIRGLSAEIWSG